MGNPVTITVREGKATCLNTGQRIAIINAQGKQGASFSSDTILWFIATLD